MARFTHIHVHSHYSLLDGMSKVPDLISKAMDCGMYALALTDHGNMFGIKEFTDQANKINKKNKDKIKEQEAILADDASTDEQKSAASEEIEKLKKKFFKPIIGVEAYCARRTLYDKDKNVKFSDPESGRERVMDLGGHHLVLLAKNKKGYQNLCKLISTAWIDGNYGRPRIDKDILAKYSEGLIVSSACLGGELPQLIMAGKLDEAEAAVNWFKSIFGDDYYIEIQRHKTDKPGSDRNVYKKQCEVNPHLIELARKTQTKIVASNDVHFVEEHHGEAHDRLICLSTGRMVDDADRMRYTKQEWLKTPDEMLAVFSDIPEALENTMEIADKVETYSIESGPIMPMFDIPKEFGTEEEYRQKFTEEDLYNEFTTNEKGEVVVSREEGEDKIKKLGGYDKIYRMKLEADYLSKLAWEGARMRYGDELTEEQRERIIFELHIMKTMGFPGYFLIVQDYIRAAREELSVMVGPGRGSAAGSVVAYCLKITDIDPLKYDLLFERFLNPDRISLPDIDVDFDDDGRGDVLRWVTRKYGVEKVAHIITYGTMATKSSIKDVGRVQNVPLKVVNELTACIPDKFGEELADPKTKKIPKVNLKNCFKYVQPLKEALESDDPNISSMMEYAEELEDTIRQVGIHACGVIIGADDLTKFVPISTVKDKETDEDVLVTQYDGHVIESVGLIKMDFLGLKTLSIIKEALKNIKHSKGIDVDIDAIPIDDEKTYELYSSGQTIGTFQFESPGMQKYLRELRPSTFEDLIAMNALYRPGPMEYIPTFIKRKHGIEPIEYDIPIMEKYLKDTYGVTVYQEQVMLLSRLLADFTRGESDALRKAMGKKLIAVLEKLKPKFINGGQKNGHDLKALEKIWADWEKFASYAFNKSHATCYSWVAYQTAYLKAHYPGEYMAANLTRNKDNPADVAKFMKECSNMGLKVLGPDINESELYFTTNSDGHIRFGLGGIKGVGESAVNAIVSERVSNGPYKDLFDFVERVNLQSCNKKNIENLALAGAFDNFEGVCREQILGINSKNESVLDTLVRYGAKVQAEKQMAVVSLFDGMEEFAIKRPELPKVEKWSALDRLNKEKELVGIYLSAHPLDDFSHIYKYVCNATMSDLNDADAYSKSGGADASSARTEGTEDADASSDKEEKAMRIESIRNGRRCVLIGMVTNIRQGKTKRGSDFGILTVDDFSGSHEFALFGNDYINYAKYFNLTSYLLIRGEYAKRQYGDDIEFKISSIDLLAEVKDNLISTLTIEMLDMKCDWSFVDEIMSLSQSADAGESTQKKLDFKMRIRDSESGRMIDCKSTRNKFVMSNSLVDFLEKGKKEKAFMFSFS